MPIRNHVKDLTGSYSIYGDGNLGRQKGPAAPPDLVIMGLSGKGVDYRPQAYTADTIDSLNKAFGPKGDLLAQVQEMQTKGLNEVMVMRIGTRPCFVQHVGRAIVTPALQTDGYWIECIPGGTEYKDRFGLSYDNSTGELVIKDLTAGVIVFSNNDKNPIDLGQVIIRGTANFDTANTNRGPDLGTLTFDSNGNVTSLADSNFVKLSALATTDPKIKVFNGDDGEKVSRMRLYEGVFQGMSKLEGQRYRYLAAHPLATLDCPAQTSLAALTAKGTAYPNPNSSSPTQPDALGKVYIEWSDDKYEFYWDVDGDGKPEYWSVNDYGDYEGTSKEGKVFGTAADFLEPNFAFTYAYDCLRKSIESHFCQAIVGVEHPAIGKSLSSWVGKEPTYSTTVDGTVTVTANGTGLLGHKYTAGTTTFRSGKAYGGFIETSEPYFDSGTETLDQNDQPVDMGKFLSLWATPETFDPRLSVNNNNAYLRISPASYAAFRASLSAYTSPTHQVFPTAGSVLTGALTRPQLSSLQKMRYTVAKQDFRGIKIQDAPSAAHPSSDYTRQGSIELVEAWDEVVRNVVDPYLGRHMAPEEEIALQKDLVEAMNGMIGAKLFVRGSNVRLVISPQDRILGQALVESDLVLPFELRRITHATNMRQG